MKSLLKLAAFVSVTPLLALACASGVYEEGDLSASEVTTDTAPTEPTPEAPATGKPIPQPAPEDADPPKDAAKSADAGKDGAPSSTSSDAGAKPPTGPCTATPPSNVCGLVPQCGCASNQTCDVTDKATGGVSCVKAGNKATGKPCTATKDCDVGLTCAYGTCRPYCAAVGQACTGSGLGPCEALYEQGASVPSTQVCSIKCDLHDPGAACGSNNCVWDSTTNVTDCDRAGSLAAFSPCSKYDDCKPGLACVTNPLYGTECEPWCRIGVAGDCPVLSFCQDVYRDKAPMVGSTKLGLCQ